MAIPRKIVNADHPGVGEIPMGTGCYRLVRDTDRSPGSGWIESEKLVLPHGQAVGQQLAYSLQESYSFGCERRRNPYGCRIPQGALGGV